MADRRAAAKKAARTRKLRAAGKKAARTRRLSAAGKKQPSLESDEQRRVKRQRLGSNRNRVHPHKRLILLSQAQSHSQPRRAAFSSDSRL
jgi:hypothetical protein